CRIAVMKIVALLLTLALTVIADPFKAYPGHFTIDSRIFDTGKISWIAHSGPGAFDNYLIQILNFQYVKPVFDVLNTTVVKYPLINRGESHITVITPPEFWKILKPAGVTIDEVNAIAVSNRIQDSDFDIMCMGRERSTINGTDHEVYSILLKNT